MLVLGRRRGEDIMLGDNIRITIVDIQGDMVKIGIEAPKDVKVYRKEVYDEICLENQRAVSNPSKLADKLAEFKKMPK